MYDFRKKPIVVKAIQLSTKMSTETLEGVMTGQPGDWLIQGAHGEMYFIKDDIFRDTYKPHTKSVKSYYEGSKCINAIPGLTYPLGANGEAKDQVTKIQSESATELQYNG